MSKLINAILNKDITEIKRLLQEEYKNVALINQEKEVNGWNALCAAVYLGDVECVQVLLEAGADVNYPLNDGMTPLHVSIIYYKENQLLIIQRLLDYGANINVNYKDKTPLILANEKGLIQIQKLLEDATKEYCVIFNKSSGEVYLQERKEKGKAKKVLNLPRTRTRYELIFSIIDAIVIRTLQKDFSFEQDRVAFLLREAFAFLVPNINPIQEEHKKSPRLRGPTISFGVEEFDICKRFLDGTRKKDPERTKEKKHFLNITEENNILDVLDGYASEDSEEDLTEKTDEENQLAAGINKFIEYLNMFPAPKIPEHTAVHHPHILSNTENRDLEKVLDKFKKAKQNLTNEFLEFDVEGHLLDSNKTKIITRFVIPEFRGINHMPGRFTDQVRRVRRSSTFQEKSSNKPFYSEAALMSTFDFYRNDATYQNFFDDKALNQALENNAKILEKTLLSLKDKDFILAVNLSHSEESGTKIFSNLLDLLQHIYSNGIIKAQRLLRFKSNEGSSPYFELDLPNGYNPFVSESEEPYHAMKYACGLKPLYEPATLRPRYNKNGKPSFPYLGEICITLRGINVVASENERTLVRQLRYLTLVEPDRLIVPELEATGMAWLHHGEVVYSETVKCPSFSGKYKSKYAEQYGLTPHLFELFKFHFTNKAHSLEIQERIERVLLEWLCCYKAIWLMEKAKNIAKKRGEVLVFRSPDSVLSTQIPKRDDTKDAERIQMLKDLSSHLRTKSLIKTPIFNQSLGRKSDNLKLYAFSELEVQQALQELKYTPEKINKFLKEEDALRTPPSRPIKPRTSLSNGSNSSLSSFSNVSPYRSYTPSLSLLEQTTANLSNDTGEKLRQNLHKFLAQWNEQTLNSVINKFGSLNLNQKTSFKTDLEKQARQYGFKCQDVKGDGKCFYYALVELLKSIDNHKNITVERCIQLLVDHILEYKEQYKEFFDKDLDAFIGQIIDGKEWADNPIIQAFSRIFNINIVIIRHDGQAPHVFKRKNPVETFYFGYEVGIHYQALKKDTTIVPYGTSLELLTECLNKADPDQFEVSTHNPDSVARILFQEETSELIKFKNLEETINTQAKEILNLKAQLMQFKQEESTAKKLRRSKSPEFLISHIQAITQPTHSENLIKPAPYKNIGSDLNSKERRNSI